MTLLPSVSVPSSVLLSGTWLLPSWAIRSVESAKQKREEQLGSSEFIAALDHLPSFQWKENKLLSC